MLNKRIIIPLLLILFMASMAAFGAPVYVNVGPTTEFDGDIKIISEIVAEGTTPDDWETTVDFTDPTADRTITIPDYDVTVGSAILLTVTDNEATAENNAILFTSGGVEAGVLNIESDGGDFYYNPSTGLLTATSYAGDGSALTGVGTASAIALTMDVRADEDLKKGDPIYISGALGAARPKVKLIDADDPAKIRMAGAAATDIANGANGLVRTFGLITSIDTLGATDANPNNEAWVAGQLLYSTLDGGGGYTWTRPTSGRVIKAAFSLLGAHNTDTLLIFSHENPCNLASAAAENIMFRLGASDDSTKIQIKDFANNEVAMIDDGGNADFTTLILDTALLIAEGGTNSAAALTNDRVMVSSGGAIIHSATITVTELGLLNGLGNTIVTNANACTDLEGTGLSIAAGVLNWACTVNGIDSANYTDGSIDHEHLHNDIIHGMTVATLAASDEYLFWDETAGALRKITWANLMGTIGLADLASSTSANLISTLSDEIGTGKARFDTSVTSKTGVGTLNVSEAGTILVSAAGAAYTLTLPTASGNIGLSYRFIKTDANYTLITLDGNAAETLNYENSTGTPNTTYGRLNTYCAEVTIVSDNSNWQVIDEALGQVPTCNCYLSATQENIPNTTLTLVELDTENYDIGSNFNTTTHLFTCPVSGKYEVSAIIGYTAVITDSVYYVVVRKNIATITNPSSHSSTTSNLNCTGITAFACSKDDTINMSSYVNTGVDTVDILSGIDTGLIVRLVSKD